jgi:Peptidase C80 family
MKYDHQFIIYFTGGGDNVPRDNAEILMARAAYEGALRKTDLITLEEDDKSGTYDFSGFSHLVTNNERIYVVGHGTDTSDSVGGCNAEDLGKSIKSLAGTRTIKRVSIVACHSGGDGNTIAPHRFVVDLWDHVKDRADEVTGYTGTVRMDTSKVILAETKPASQPEARGFRAWNGEAWWLIKGVGKKIVGHQHEEDDQSRKIYVRRGSGGQAAVSSTGWTNKL